MTVHLDLTLLTDLSPPTQINLTPVLALAYPWAGLRLFI